MPALVRLGRSPLGRISVALVATVLAYALHHWASDYFGASAPFVTFSPAVMLAALLAGFGAGLLATALATALWVAFVLPTASAPAEAVALSTFVVIGVLVSAVAGLYRAAKERLIVFEREHALRETQEQLQAFFHNTSVGTMLLDHRGLIVLVNERFCQITGYTAEELVGTSPAHLAPPADREREHRNIEGFLAGDRPEFEAEKPCVRKDGRLIWIRLSVALIRDEQGRPARAAGILQDVTATVTAEEARRKSALEFQALADNMAQLAWMADENGRIFWFSERWFEYTGTSPEQMERDGWLAVVHPDDRQGVLEKVHERFATAEPWEGTFRMRAADGGYRWFLTRVVPVRDVNGAVIRWFGTNTDITEQREQEQALREADRRKDEFLAILSHELRNPLAPIRNSVYVLQRSEPGGEKAARALAVIERQVQHMARLVDDLLDVTRIGRGKIRLQRERLELGAVVRRAAEDQRDEFAQNGIELATSLPAEPLFVDGDATRLAQVFGNLLHNAGKFTPRGGRVTLSLRCEDGHAEIEVSDTGTGIAPETLKRIFEPFVQGELTLDRSRGGLGLGLALVKGIVDLHGGTVSGESEGQGRGARFRVRLPLEAAPAGATAAVRPGAHPGRRVLVIEDDFDSARSLKEALEISGHRVELALTGPDGIEAAHRFQPDVIVCDIGLPGMDGYEVARRVRADPVLRGTALVALSGYALEEDLERCRAAGFDRHVVKPADPAAVESTVASLAG